MLGTILNEIIRDILAAALFCQRGQSQQKIAGAHDTMWMLGWRSETENKRLKCCYTRRFLTRHKMLYKKRGTCVFFLSVSMSSHGVVPK